MGLQKQITLRRSSFDPDLIAEYWSITNVSWDKRFNQTNVSLSLFVDSTGDQPLIEGSQDSLSQAIVLNTIDVVQFSFTGSDFTRAQLYAMIKQDSRFTDATDS